MRIEKVEKRQLLLPEISSGGRNAGTLYHWVDAAGLNRGIFSAFFQSGRGKAFESIEIILRVSRKSCQRFP